LHVLQSCRRFSPALLVATGIVLLAGCQGLAPAGSSGNSTLGSTLAASSPTLSFGNVQTSKSSNLSETLTNTGTSAVTVSQAKVSGAGFSAGGLGLPMTLSPQQSVTLTVIFAPTASGAASGALAIVSTAGNSPLTIALSGTGTAQSPVSGAPILSASSSTLSFGKVQKGKSSNLSETLTNTGASAVTISGANISGAGFSASGLGLPMTLSPQQNVTFTVIFGPTATGTASGTLAVVSTAGNSPLTIALSGTGVAQGQLSVSPTSLSFGNVVVGAKGSLNGTLGATGSSVTVSAVSINSSEFTLSGISVPATLAAGQTTSFTVTFKPAASGTASATLSFSSDAANSPTAQTLTGNGTAAPQHSVALSWNPSASTGVIGYNVYRGGVSGGPYARINSAMEAGTTYTDNNVIAGQTYYYVTTAVDGTGIESGYSNQTQAVIPTP
jgi:Cep192 domain 4/HYDIN/CFA65/VesB-like, Ig-like domain